MMLKLRELHGNNCQIIPGKMSHGTTFSLACGMEIFWKDIFLKVLINRESCGCSAIYPHLRMKGSALEELETRYIQVHPRAYLYTSVHADRISVLSVNI